MLLHLPIEALLTVSSALIHVVSMVHLLLLRVHGQVRLMRVGWSLSTMLPEMLLLRLLLLNVRLLLVHHALVTELIVLLLLRMVLVGIARSLAHIAAS